MNLEERNKKALELHKQWQGKISTEPKMTLQSRDDLANAYTPGVAAACMEIAHDTACVYDYTLKANTIAVVSDGSAVLGLGNIGPEAAMPVMEGKAALFKAFGGVNAFPICLDTQDVDEIVHTVELLAPTFGGVNLEDISAPRCFEIEQKLKERLNIPVFHDDQHGTAVVVLCGIINALRITKKQAAACRVVINGAGAAGVAIAKLLVQFGISDVIVCDSRGIVSSKSARLTPIKQQLLTYTNKEDKQGSLSDVLVGADIFIGVSVAGALSADMVKSMNSDAIIFAIANPVPEIYPDEALAAGARIAATGRSDFPNQINNVIAFPGIFKGALEAHVARITDEMLLKAAHALANLVSDQELCETFIMPDPFDKRCAEAVAQAVKECAIA